MKGEWRETESERRARFYAEIQRMGAKQRVDIDSLGTAPQSAAYAAEVQRHLAKKQERDVEKMPWYFSASRFIKDDGLIMVFIALLVGYSVGRFFS